MDDDGGGLRKKRRDSLEDSQSNAFFGDEPSPPFITSIEDFIWCCFRVDAEAARQVLPPGIQATEPATAQLAIYRHGPGWGLSHTTGGFLCIVVDGYDSPDTSEAAFNIGGYMQEPDAGRMNRHYAPFAPGYSLFQRSGREMRHSLWSADGLVVAVNTRETADPQVDMASLDRYLGYGATGVLGSTLFSVTGRTQACDLLAVEFGPAAPATWRALAPTELCWAGMQPYMLTNISAPEPLVPDVVPRAVSRAALMAILDQMHRAACILSPEGRVLHANAEAAQLLADVSGGGGRIAPAGAGFVEALAGQVRRPPLLVPAPFQVPRRGGLPPLIVQLAPIDPALAGPGTVLMLMNDPAARRDPARAELLQLLELTPAEARVAAAVGSGLSPREAAVRLGLTEATVRSTLKVVYDKLGVRRQAELVRLVGRLDPG